MKRLLVFFLILFRFPALYAQEEPADASPDNPPGLSREFVLERDIATSSRRELADWCRSLGLDDEGGKDVLAGRLRLYYRGALGSPEQDPAAAPGTAAADAAEQAAAPGTAGAAEQAAAPGTADAAEQAAAAAGAAEQAAAAAGAAEQAADTAGQAADTAEQAAGAADTAGQAPGAAEQAAAPGTADTAGPAAAPGTAGAAEQAPGAAEQAAAPGTAAAGAAEQAAGTEEPPVLQETVETGPEKRPLLIIIESARTTEYFTVESVHEEYARLQGGVSVSLKDGEINHRIRAEEILYNRTRKIMTASGSVEYVKEMADTIETFWGDGITVNLDNWSTAFMKGTSDRAISDGEIEYRFEGEVISRSGEDSTVLRRAKITNPNDDESYWSINASRLWLLPGSDWAVFNAVVKVGEIPVLYLPYFFVPADELIFHPVLGIRTREGSFVQTTTYILGRPKISSSSEESSITTIMGSGAGIEKRQEGIFLRSTGRKLRDESEVKLSLLADAYANLGYYLGTELIVPPRGPFGELLFSLGLGFSRDIAYDYGNYTPFYPKYDGASRWRRSHFFDAGVPFRYRLVSVGSVEGSGALAASSRLSWNLPLYSDPYVDNDFMRRSEDSSLFTLIRSSTSPDTNISDSSIGSYNWNITGNISFVTAGMSPYINELSITSIANSVSFETRSTKPAPDSKLSYPPDLSFFYPDRFTLFSIAASIGGEPLSLGERAQAGETEEAVLPGWGRPISPWPEEPEAQDQEEPLSLSPPELNRTLQVPALGGRRFTLDYRLTPSAVSEIKLNSSSWTGPDDIDWGDLAYQFFTIGADGAVGLTLSENRNIYTHNLRFYGASSWQDYTYLNKQAPEYDTPAERENAMRQVHNMTYLSGSVEYGFTLWPFYQSQAWSTTNFQYNLKGLMGKSEYDLSGDSWDLRWGRWNREDIEFHRVQANFNLTVMDKLQSLYITADIPPEENSLAWDATVRAGASETNARSRIWDPFDDPSYEPIYFTETLRFTDTLFFWHYMVYDPELSDFTILNSSLTWGGLRVSFTATRSQGYYLVDQAGNPAGGWHLKSGDEKLNPQELSVGYTKTHSFNDGRRLSFEGNVNTGLTFDLQRYSYSKFYFTLGLTAKINRFFDITVNSHSENSEIFRYFQGLPFFNDVDIEMPGEKNPFVDLINSFRFDSVDKRKASGFKLKSFGLDLVHHLGDWDATLGMRLTPEFDSAALQYKFNTEISFTVQWKPIREIKTSLEYTTDKGLSYE
ncbi:MAG: LPS-assembly protein LptD [Spirochaetaceae bacterium]|nr:LPS-assembly protein LptD [Spirochaetaceae bacterium]